jgi:hypothetical protein
MPRHLCSAFLLSSMVLFFGLVPVQAATYQTSVLSNEGSNGLVSPLVAGGYGNENIYQAMEDAVANTNPTAGFYYHPCVRASLAERLAIRRCLHNASGHPHRGNAGCCR